MFSSVSSSRLLSHMNTLKHEYASERICMHTEGYNKAQLTFRDAMG